MIQTLVDRFKSRQLERYFMPTLAVAVLGAMAISLMIGLQQSVWFDEAYSVFLAKQSVLNVIHFTAVDAHPPLYYLILKGWGELFGWSELALRSLSILFMGGAVAIGSLLVKRLFGVRTALMTLPFIALSPLLLRYGFEIRMYSLASLIGIGATYVLVSAVETKVKSRQWKLYGVYAILLALGMYVHYFMALLWGAHFLWLTWRAYRDRQPIVKTPWCIAFIGALVLFLPWLPVLGTQIGSGTQATVLQAMTIENLVGIISFSFLYQPVWHLSGYGTIIVVFLMMALGMFIARTFKKASKKERDYLWLFVLYLMIPVVLIALVSLYQPLYLERYVSPFMIGAMLLVGVAVSYSAKKISSWTGVMVLVLYAGLLLGVGQLAKVGNTNYQRLLKPTVSSVVSSMDTCDKNTTVLAADPYVAVELSYYLPKCEIRFYSAADMLKGGFAPLSDNALRIAHPSSELKNSSKLYYVYYDKPRLTMPANLVQVGHADFDKLSVDTYTAQ